MMQNPPYQSGYDGDFFNTGNTGMGAFGQGGGNPGFGQTGNRRGPIAPRPQHIGTEEIKQIVYALNRPPFNQNLTLVSFDEKLAIELLEILNKVLTHLDENQDKDVREENQAAMASRITEFLKVLGYPANYQGEIESLIGKGDKRTLYSILHWILQRVPDLKRRAYLAKFLVTLAIPDDYMMDAEIRDIFQSYKDLQTEFQTTHKHVESLRVDSMIPTELKKQIAQLEQERDQLKSKISILKGKNANNAQFQELLQATSQLRKEQEVDARLLEKLREQQIDYQQCEQMFMNTKQRLIDQRRQRNDEISADQMVENLKTQTKKNRQIAYDRLQREYQDKTHRIQELEVILSEPVTTQNEVDMLSSEVHRLKKEIHQLQEKLKKVRMFQANKSQSNPQDDKLAVYKTQTQAMSNKKQSAMEELRKAELEKKSYELKLAQKDEQFAKSQGAPYMRRDDLKAYANQLRTKSNQYKKMKAALNQIRNEYGVLTRTSQILKSKAQNADDVLNKLQEKRGKQGYSKAQSQLQQEAQKNYQINEEKAETLEEISRVIEKINKQLTDKKAKLAPQIKQLRTLRAKHQEVENIHNQKKLHYENMVMGLESDKAKLESDSKQMEEQYHKAETKIHSSYIQNMITSALSNDVDQEEKRVAYPQKKNEKSQTKKYTEKISHQEIQMSELRKKQKYVKDNQENHVKQVKMFGDLAKLLQTKMSVGVNSGEGGMGYQDNQAEGFERFVVRE